MLRKIIISSIIIIILVCLAFYYWKSCEIIHPNYDNYTPLFTPPKKKVRFKETEDFIYYDPADAPQDLKK